MGLVMMMMMVRFSTAMRHSWWHIHCNEDGIYGIQLGLQMLKVIYNNGMLIYTFTLYYSDLSINRLQNSLSAVYNFELR